MSETGVWKGLGGVAAKILLAGAIPGRGIWDGGGIQWGWAGQAEYDIYVCVFYVSSQIWHFSSISNFLRS